MVGGRGRGELDVGIGARRWRGWVEVGWWGLVLGVRRGAAGVYSYVG